MRGTIRARAIKSQYMQAGVLGYAVRAAWRKRFLTGAGLLLIGVLFEVQFMSMASHGSHQGRQYS